MQSFVLWEGFVPLGPLSVFLAPQEHINLKLGLHLPQIASLVLPVLTAAAANHILNIVPSVLTAFASEDQCRRAVGHATLVGFVHHQGKRNLRICAHLAIFVPEVFAKIDTILALQAQ